MKLHHKVQAVSRLLLILISSMLVLSVSLAKTANAERRLALVIGIDDYKNVPKLERAAGDARAISASLRKLGFEVTELYDQDRRSLNRAISKFARKLTPTDTAFIHFSGHGVEIDGQNFLLPADTPKPTDGDVDFVRSEAIGMNRLIRRISVARTRIFVIDACRDNPFQQTGVRSVGSTRGLTRIEAPSGTFIMYSAGHKQKALDKLNANDQEKTSVYTRVLLDELQKPNKSIAKIAREVRLKVEKLARSVGHDQRPAYYDELSSNLVLNVAAKTDPVKAEPKNKQIKTPSFSTKQLELAYWQSIAKSKDPALFEAYLKDYPEGVFANLARAKIATLTPQKKQIRSNEDNLKAPKSEDNVWDEAEARRTTEHYDIYLKKFPNGRFAAIARQRIKEINEAKTPAPETTAPTNAPSKVDEEKTASVPDKVKQEEEVAPEAKQQEESKEESVKKPVTKEKVIKKKAVKKKRIIKKKPVKKKRKKVVKRTKKKVYKKKKKPVKKTSKRKDCTVFNSCGALR